MGTVPDLEACRGRLEIQFVGEVEHLHSTRREDKTNGRAGVSFEGLQNTYFQLLWTDQGKHWLVQIGTGF